MTVILGGVAALLIVVGISYALAYSGKILPGVKIADVELGNMTGEEAADLLKKRIEGGMRTIRVVSGEYIWEIEPEEIGLKVDLPGSVNEAWLVGRKGGLLERLGQAQTSYFDGKVLPLKLAADNEKVALVLREIEATLNEDEVKPAVTIKKQGSERMVEVSTGINGLEVDTRLLGQGIFSRWSFFATDDQEVPLKRIEVEVSREVAEKVRQEAASMLGKELIVKLEEEEWKWSDEELIGLIKVSEKPGFDEQEVKDLVLEFAASINSEPQNAAFKFEDGKVQEFRPGKDGVTVVQEDLVKQIMGSYSPLTQTEKVELAVFVSKTPPKIQTSEVNNLGIRELLGKGESTFHHSIPNRVHNVSLAASRMAGILVAPGEEFSFNKSLGDISASTGYKTAYVISGGRTVLGDGGGVCQVSTTIFRAALDAGLPITERKAHAYRVGYYEQDYPPGIDATVYSPSADFKFKNDTSAHILIQPIIDADNYYLSFEIYGTSDGRKVELSKPKIWGQSPALATVYQDDPTLAAGTLKQVDWSASGAKTSFDYKVTRNEEVLFEKTFVSSYRPWAAVYLRGTKI